MARVPIRTNRLAAPVRVESRTRTAVLARDEFPGIPVVSGDIINFTFTITFPDEHIETIQQRIYANRVGAVTSAEVYERDGQRHVQMFDAGGELMGDETAVDYVPVPITPWREPLPVLHLMHLDPVVKRTRKLHL